ncbi:MAG: ABC transporter ATP-binding protein [Pseudomonadota bacterium]
MAEPVLELSGVVKEYGEAVITRVLHGLDLRIEPGEFAALTGPSGSGKSTLLNIMGLLDRPTEGSVRVRGQDISVLDDDELAQLRGRSLGFVFQFHHLLAAFTARENIYMPVLLDRGRVDRAMEQRADELLAAVGLQDKAGRRASQLSGGQQQRVAVARALAVEPALVLADEPTGNLDTETADQIFDLLRDINKQRGTAFLIVTHDPRLADRCDRIINLVDGRIARDQRGSPQGPCRACGFGPCLRSACVRAEDIPRAPAAIG